MYFFFLGENNFFFFLNVFIVFEKSTGSFFSRCGSGRVVIEIRTSNEWINCDGGYSKLLFTIDCFYGGELKHFGLS